MKIKISITIFFFLLAFLSVNAQFESFNISSYKLPDIKTSYLDLSLDLNHSFSKNYFGINETVLQDNRSTIAGGLLDLNLYHFRNRANYQGYQRAYIRLEPDFSKTTSSAGNSKQNIFPGSINIFSSNRFYNNSNKFIEIDADLGYWINNRLSSSSSRSERNKERYISFSVPVAVGYGRIEPVEDARLAVYILEELSKNGRIAELPSEAMILELAQKISRIKRKRFFDSRIRKIEEMQVIDSFLLANKIVTKSDIVYFTRLNDMWDYASGPERNSGFSVSVGIDNKIQLNKYFNKVTLPGTGEVSSDGKSRGYMFGPFINLRQSDPLDLYWQSDISLTMAYNYMITRDPLDKSNNISNYELNELSATGSYYLQYIPDSRSSFGLFVGGSYRYSFGEQYGYDSLNDEYVPGKFKGKQLTPYTSLVVQYYISPQLRLHFNWSLGLGNLKETNKYGTALPDYFLKYNSFNNNIYLRITYSIF